MVGLALVATTTGAVDKKPGAGTLARVAIPARLARLAEIAKDATPPKPGRPPQLLGGGTVGATATPTSRAR